ncbi:hypothetical protein T265_14860, partial [Opisthorchis viverrini]
GLFAELDNLVASVSSPIEVRTSPTQKRTGVYFRQPVEENTNEEDVDTGNRISDARNFDQYWEPTTQREELL